MKDEGHSLRSRGRDPRAGRTLIEMLVAMLTLTFVIGGGAALYTVGYQQQKVTQSYSMAQTNMRSALAEANRTIRHGCEVVTANTVYNGIAVTTFANNAVRYSNATQLCIRAPQPTATGGYVEIRFYLSNGTLYCQRADSLGTLTTLMTGVTTLTFNYFQTSATQRTAVNNVPGPGVTDTPDMATEVQVTLTGKSGSSIVISATAVTTVNLRNKIAASGIE